MELLPSTVEAEWLRELLMDLPIVEKPIPTVLMNCPNDSMKSSRHIKRQLKSVKKLKNSGVIALDYVHTAKNLADQFTKGLSQNVIDNASLELGMRPT